MEELDPRTAELRAPLPGGALAATLTYRAARMGRDRTVPRSQATHADLELELIGPRYERRRLTLEEARAFVEGAARLRADATAREWGSHERVEAAREARRELAATMRVDCGRCGIPREYEGRRDLLSAGQPGRVAATGEVIQELRPTTRTYHEYACPRCGSVEWFRHGAVDHPVEPRA